MIKEFKQAAIGIDLGGTNLRGGLVTESGRILAKVHQRLPVKKSPEAVVAAMAALIGKLEKQVPKKQMKLVGVGIGAPGGIDAKKGVVTQSPHLPLWKNVPLRNLLAEDVGLPVWVDNDANCFALGESTFGNGKGAKNLLALTLGTGIGGGLMIDGKIWHGDSGMAAEFGHMVLDVNGPKCACGARGCFEAFASGSALIRMAKEEIAKGEKTLLAKTKDIRGENIEKAADRGDRLSRQLFERLGTYLGLGIGNLVNMTGITQVVVGGKVIFSWEYFYPKTMEAIHRQCFRSVAKKVTLKSASLGDDAGLLGASLLVR